MEFDAQRRPGVLRHLADPMRSLSLTFDL